MVLCSSTITRTAGASATLFPVFLKHFLRFIQSGVILLLMLIPVEGIIGAVAKDFFNSDITMEVVDQLEELERTGKKEHVVFLVSEQPRAPITESPRSPAGRHEPEVSGGKT